MSFELACWVLCGFFFIALCCNVPFYYSALNFNSLFFSEVFHVFVLLSHSLPEAVMSSVSLCLIYPFLLTYSLLLFHSMSSLFVMCSCMFLPSPSSPSSSPRFISLFLVLSPSMSINLSLCLICLNCFRVSLFVSPPSSRVKLCELVCVFMFPVLLWQCRVLCSVASVPPAVIIFITPCCVPHVFSFPLYIYCVSFPLFIVRTSVHLVPSLILLLFMVLFPCVPCVPCF